MSISINFLRTTSSLFSCLLMPFFTSQNIGESWCGVGLITKIYGGRMEFIHFCHSTGAIHKALQALDPVRLIEKEPTPCSHPTISTGSRSNCQSNYQQDQATWPLHSSLQMMHLRFTISITYHTRKQ